MPRAPFQVLVLPYREIGNGLEFAVLLRSDGTTWQGIAGGGEDDETPTEAAYREALEEAGIPREAKFMPLDTKASVPANLFDGSEAWGEGVYVVPEHTFGVDCTGRELELSREHAVVEWVPYAQAQARLTYDSNRTALWELHQKLRSLGPRGE